MDVERELKTNPPKEPLTNLANVVADFYERFPMDRRDRVIEFTREATTYIEAVRRAVMARDSNGKMHNHQSRVPAESLHQLGLELVRMRRRARHLTDFDDLYDLIVGRQVKGIGPVTAYDVAVRLGAWLDLEPTSLYLHAGVRDGWRALTGDGQGERITVDRLPIELRGLPMDDVEDMMCTYRMVFSRWIWGWGAAAVRLGEKKKQWCPAGTHLAKEGWHFFPLVGWVCTGCARAAWEASEAHFAV